LQVQGTPASIRKLAEQGLEQSDRFALIGRARRNADAASEALEQIRREADATHDTAVLEAVALADAARPHVGDEGCLAVSRAILQAVSQGVTGGVCPMAALALRCLHVVEGDRSRLADALLEPVARLDPHAAVVARLRPDAERVLTELRDAPPSDVRGCAISAVHLGIPSQVALDAIHPLAVQDGDARALGWYQRLDAWRSADLLPALQCMALNGLASADKDDPIHAARLLGEQTSSAAPVVDRVLDEAAAAGPNPWLDLRARLQPLVHGTPAAADLRAAVLDALDGHRALDRTGLETLATRLPAHLDDPALLARVLDELAPQGDPGFVAQVRDLTQALPVPLRAAWLKRAIPLLPRQEAALDLAALADHGRNLLRSVPNDDKKLFDAAANAILDACAARGKPLQAALARATREVVASAASRDEALQATERTFGQLGSGPLETVPQCVSAALNVATSGYYASEAQELRALPGMLGFVEASAKELKDPLVLQEVGLLQRLLARPGYGDPTVVRGVVEGLKQIVNQDRAYGNRVATMADAVARYIQYGPDELAFHKDVIDVLKASPDSADAATMMARAALAPLHSQRVSALLRKALSTLAGGPTPPLLTLGRSLLSEASGAEAYDVAARAVVEGGLEVAKNRHDSALAARFEALRQISDFEFGTVESRSTVLGRAFSSWDGERGIPGLVSYLLREVGGSMVDHDKGRLLDLAFDAARAASGGPRKAYVDALAALARVPLSYASYRLTLSSIVLAAAGADDEGWPGDLAAVAQEARRNCCYGSADVVALGRAVLEGVERLAAGRRDTEYGPILVADARKRMEATTSVDEQAAIVTRAFDDLAKLRGDSYRMALAEMERGKSPEEQPAIDTSDGLTIGGIKIPRRQ
jgi:hypothetical protein